MLTVLTGFISGIISGMGIGGGAVLIPALTIFEGVAQKIAQGLNLTYFIPTAVISLFIHFKNKLIDVPTAVSIGISGTGGAALGAVFAALLGGEVLKKMFAVFLLMIGIYEIYKGCRL